MDVVTAFHRSESQNESLYRSSTCQDILDLPQQVATAQEAKIVSRHDPTVNW